MDLKKLTELLEAKRPKQSHVQITAKDLCDLVEKSGTDNEGLKRGAKALKESPEEKIVLEFKDFEHLVKGCTNAAAPVASVEKRDPPKP